MPSFMNEGEIDYAAQRYASHPTLGRATRLLAAYRNEVNRNSDGWPYWGWRCSDRLAQLIRAGNATEGEVTRACAPIKSFCTRKRLRFPVDGM